MSSYSLVEKRYRRLVRQVLYGLRTQYGSRIAVYKLIDADTNYSTGVKTIEKTSYELVAITAPGKVSREVLQSISQISANKTMVYGGTFDSTVKTFVIDGRHLPDDFEFEMDDWIVYNNARFELKDVYKLDYHAGWIITAKEIIGQHAEQIFHLSAENTLSLSHVAASVPWTYWALEQTIPLTHGVVSTGSIFNRSGESKPTLGVIPQYPPTPPPPTPGLDLRDVATNVVERPRSPGSTIGIDHSVSVQKIVYQNPQSKLNIHDHHQYMVGLQCGIDTSLDLTHSVHHDGSAWMRGASNILILSHEVIVQKTISRNPESILSLQSEAIAQKVIHKSATSILATNQQLDLSVFRNLTASTIISLDSEADRQGTFNRGPSSDIGIIQDIAKTKVIFESASSTIGIDHHACELATALISAWYMDETSGTRYDYWNGNDLADINTVGYVTGKVGNAANFIASSNQQLAVGNNASLQTGDIDFMFTGWIYLYDGPAEYKLWGKWDEGSSEREYMIRIKPSGQIAWGVSRNGILRTEITRTGVLSTDTWYFVCTYHDSVNNQLGISINNEAFTTSPYNFGVYTGSADFTVSGDAELLAPLDGAIDAIHFWKRILTPAEISEMYNNGNGRQVPTFC